MEDSYCIYRRDRRYFVHEYSKVSGYDRQKLIFERTHPLRDSTTVSALQLFPTFINLGERNVDNEIYKHTNVYLRMCMCRCVRKQRHAIRLKRHGAKTCLSRKIFSISVSHFIFVPSRYSDEHVVKIFFSS